MSLTQIIWIAGIVAFFIVGMAIANAISQLAKNFDALELRVERPLDVKVALENHILPLEVKVKLEDYFKVELSEVKVALENHIGPLKVELENDILRPLKVELESPSRPLEVKVEFQPSSAPLTVALETDPLPLKVELENHYGERGTRSTVPTTR
jgi:hypothetical protein